MSPEKAAPEELVGQTVVLDAAGQFIYLGTLRRMDEHFIELEDADVHDGSESPTPKERYVIESKKYGVKKNRKTVYVRAALVTSMSRLEDVIEY
jgi:small nuclear ribonucleoprotein (snRNP)-like protein